MSNINLNQSSIRDVLYSLINLQYNVVLINDRVWITESFFPSGRSNEYTELVGRDITDLVINQFVGHNQHTLGNTKTDIHSQISKINIIRCKFHKDIQWQELLTRM